MSAETFAVNQPPNAEVRIRQFLDLSAEYLRLVPPRTESPLYFTAENEDALASLREGLLAHVLMRKFITKGESVYLPRVFEALLEDYKDSIPADLARQLRVYMYELSAALKKITEHGVQYGINGADAVSDRVMLDRYLNGRLLHSDHDKWQQADSSAFRVMLGSWLSTRAEFRDHLQNSRHNVSFAVGSYALFPLPPES
ncbi:hypothetical protein SAT01_32650 [Sinomonas atrocyanea]|uniref:hypothetical protein n=1 Tax=Sinomonas atrocyanea TaxID=37927 RepID=UPI001144E3F3|nr:hypothetical protein [Sinomonas atrocyanea]GEB65817.1 hypothetical protein SAT01_32650 [Sinomonas atrocyanea]GGG61205.1 hypothetical protein GCM10007172_10320 [Sinomonas atrocyanea]